MSTLELNLAILQTIPAEKQEEIHKYLVMNFCVDNPYIPMSREQILADLEASREESSRGEVQDFDEALDEIIAKYDL